MIIDNESQITEAVVRKLAATPDPRRRELMTSLVRHLHAFVREARPSEDEYDFALRFIAELGMRTDATRNEVVICADTLGISTLVCLLANPIGAGQTDPALLGPFWRKNAPRCRAGETIARSDTPGDPVFVTGRVLDAEGRPVPGAMVDVWQASPVGLYENQDPEQADFNLRGVFEADGDGRYAFRTVKPAGYPVPTDGPVGKLLEATARHPYRPAHIHFMVTHPGYRTLTTQVFAADDPYLNDDVTFSVIRSLVGRFARHEGGKPPANDVVGAWYTLSYDLALEPGEMRVPVPPIP